MAIHMKSTEQYVLWFCLLCNKMVLPFESKNKLLQCNHSNESYGILLSRGFEKSKVNSLSISSMGGNNWLEISGVSKIRGFEKSGLKLHCLTEANPREMCHGSKNREVRKITDRSAHCTSVSEFI